MNTEKLKSAYETNKAARAICDELAGRERNQNETRLERILHLLGDQGFKRSDVISGFRALEDATCGKYVEGRRGWPSRFVWDVKSLDVASVARGEQPPEQQAQDAGDDPGMIEHSYVLRPELSIAFDLPDDLTTAEAARLAGFLQTLPFSEGR